MGWADAVAAPKTRDRLPWHQVCELALEAILRGHAEYILKSEGIGYQEVIDVPPRPPDTFFCAPDVACHPGKPARTKRGADIDMEPAGECDRSESAYGHSAGDVLKDQAVDAATHT